MPQGCHDGHPFRAELGFLAMIEGSSSRSGGNGNDGDRDGLFLFFVVAQSLQEPTFFPRTGGETASNVSSSA